MEDQKKDLLGSGARKIVSTVGVQGIIVALSFVTGIILPAQMGPEMYGYWQMYVMYLAYLNLLGVGYSDGMALYYGGRDYEALPFPSIRSATGLGAGYLCVVTAVLYAVAGLISSEHSRFIYQMLALNVPLACIASITISTSSATNKTALYNGLNLLQRVVTVVMYMVLMKASLTDYRSMIWGDTFARVFFAVVCLFVGRKMFFGKRESLREGIAEFRQKSAAGMSITLAAIAAGVMPVAGKFVVQFSAPVKAFGEYSFGMSLLHIVITFTSTAGLVVFPLLKRLKDKELSGYYYSLSTLCGTLLFAAMFAYLPCKWLILWIVPEYEAVLDYLHVLLIICVPLGRLQLLLLSYFKAMRLERKYFIANVVGVSAMLGITWGAYALTQTVSAVALAASVTYMVWCVILERYLAGKLGQSKGFWKHQSINICLMVAFVVFASMNSTVWFLLGYGAVYVLYIVAQRKELKASLRNGK